MMPAREISSNQRGVHENLITLVTKHLSTPFQKPYAEHTRQAFRILDKRVQAHAGSVVLDACCGVGESTAILAARHRDALVIGVDKSAHRLNRFERSDSASQASNAVVARADLNDIWRLISDAKWPVTHQYLLYPNPWPKSSHIKRRWHGAPVFPFILKTGGVLELRSNWRLYAEEFALALSVAGFNTVVEPYGSTEAITPFERKYWASGQKSWRLICELDSM